MSGEVRATIELDGQRFDVRLAPDGDGWTADVDGHSFPVHVARNGRATSSAATADGRVFLVGGVRGRTVRVDGEDLPFFVRDVAGVAGAQAGQAGRLGPVHPPMTGTVVEIVASAGSVVEAGDVLFVLEAMKMRNQVRAPASGLVKAIHVKPGASVGPGTAVLELAEA